MDWSEAAAGTNAIGTSIISKKPIQVFSAEHYCEGFHSMTCSSSPIFHPYTKNCHWRHRLYWILAKHPTPHTWACRLTRTDD